MEVAGFPLAALLVGLTGVGATLAFWVDSATYLVSAVLIAGIAIPPVARTVAPRVGGAITAFRGELADGWRFLRASPPLFQNTLVSILAQMSVGASVALTAFFAVELLGNPPPVDGAVPGQADTMAALEAALGLGNLIGGIVVGTIGARLRKGRLVVGGFLLMGASTVVMGLSGNIPLAVGAALAVGAFNLIWLIPSQTLFGELVPSELMGRVIAIRGSLVFGTMAGAGAAASIAAEVVPVGVVIATLGAVTVLAGVVGALLPAVRDV
jgi:MFS family permease